MLGRICRADMDCDVATAQELGARDLQEDALVSHFAQGAPVGFVVLADGMGGHAAGDVVSKIVATEMFSELLFQSGDPARLAREAAPILREAAVAANACITAHALANPATTGMGATLLAPVVHDGGLSWISVGDSLLYLYRDEALYRLNEDHSLSPQIDMMVRQGLMDAETAARHPDRSTLTSVLIGAPIPLIDCPDRPVPLLSGDIVIAASDGLAFLSNEAIAEVLDGCTGATSAEIARRLIAAVADLAHEEQDNTSLAVIRITGVGAASETLPLAPTAAVAR